MWRNPRRFIFLIFLVKLGLMIRLEIKKIVLKTVGKNFGGISAPDFSVEKPEKMEHGDYATNVALILAKALSARGGSVSGGKKNPMEIVEFLAKKLESKKWRAEAARPGFINFYFKDNFLIPEIRKKINNKKAFGKVNKGRGKTVMVDYFQLNIAKRPHIGHLRSAVIGDALKRMFLLFGYKAVSDTHVGDWGTQFGILLLGFKEEKMNIRDKKILADPFNVLEELYKKENEKIEADPERREKAKLEFAKLERGDAENRKIWKWMVDISMKNLEESAGILGLESFDEHRGESFYGKDMPAIAALALKKRIAKKKSGAVIVDLSREGLDEAVLIKSDGASTYLLRDLATIQYRKKRWGFWKNIYVVDARQTHHFKQMFSVAAKIGFEGVGQSEHIEFGAMTFPEGKISTRKGNIISLAKLFSEAKARALAVIKEKNPDLKDTEVVAAKIGLGAIKYFDLSHNRRSDIVFRWGDALAFEGDTGPYLQYTHARLKSILRKAKKVSAPPKYFFALEPLEHEIFSRILAFEEAAEDSLSLYMPNVLANYLHGLAKKVNEFYHLYPVLSEQNPKKRALRLMLVDAAATAINKGLWCLGIESPEEM